MSAVLQFAVAALAYGTIAVGLVWLLERLGALRDGAIAETLWRIALYAGPAVAIVQGVLPHARDIATDLIARREVIVAAPSMVPMPHIAESRDASPAGVPSALRRAHSGADADLPWVWSEAFATMV
ncbi:MAG TPA: hypothetical protein VN581_00245, partial [Patescibacteria group bacterium]|nr:hypothetical protein [Patescibacteria group bacterium]